MKYFLFNVSIFSVLLLITFVSIFLLEDGYSDSFYLRFTSPPQQALVVGSSRAAQGVIPSVINNRLQSVYNMPLYNYSFTLNTSPYGPVYFESIRRKLQSNVDSSFFIVCVDPWTISSMGETPDDITQFPEANNFLSNIDDVSISPNLKYLLDYYPEQYYHILLARVRPNKLRLHDDGWLEVSVKMDTSIVSKRTDQKMKQYARNTERFHLSKVRLEYLKNTIKMFRKHGDIYLVRLPVHTEMLKLEHDLVPNFDELMQSLQEEVNAPYLDLTAHPDNYSFTDGNHLHKLSSAKVSEEIANWIAGLKERANSDAKR